MASLLIGSFQKPISPLSFPFAAEFFSLPTGHAQCSNVERFYAISPQLRVKRYYWLHQQLKSTGQRRITLNPRRDYIVNSASEHSLESEPSRSPWNSVQRALGAFYRFSWPHTVIGTALSIISVSLLAVEKVSDFSPLFVTGVLEVNKPYLPLASGAYSLTTGVMIVSSFDILSFWLGWIVGSWPLFWSLVVSFMHGTAYSINVPFLRWKRFAVVAAMCIFAVRAVIVQIAFYLHVQVLVLSIAVICICFVIHDMLINLNNQWCYNLI